MATSSALPHICPTLCFQPAVRACSLPPSLYRRAPGISSFPASSFPAAVPEVSSTGGVPACTPGLRDYSQELKPCRIYPSLCQPSHGTLRVAVPPSFFEERPGGLLNHPGGSPDPEGLEQGHVSSQSEISVHLQWLLFSIAVDVGSKEMEPAQPQKLDRGPQCALPFLLPGVNMDPHPQGPSP